MSSILDALRKAKKLAGGSAPQKAPAYLKSFGFAEQAKGNKTKKILLTYVVPVVVLGAIIASGVLYWINRTASSPMAEQAQLLEIDPALGTDPLFPDDDGLLPPEDGPEEGGPEEASPDGGEAGTGEVVEGDPVAAGEPEPGPSSGAQEPEPPTMEQAETSVAARPPGPPPQEEPSPAIEPDEPAAQDLDPEGAVDTGPGPATPGEDEIALQTTLAGDDLASSPNPPVVGEPRVEPAASDPFELAVHYHRTGDYLKALGYYEEVLEANPLNASAHNNLGLLHQVMSNNSEAIEEFRVALVIDDNYALAHNNLGTALLEAGEEQEAVREFQRAIDINPQYAPAITNLANYYKREGKTEQAKIQYLKALQADPSSAETHYNLGWLYEGEGETRKAIDHFNRFLELGSSQFPQFVESVEQKIRELSSGG